MLNWCPSLFVKKPKYSSFYKFGVGFFVSIVDPYKFFFFTFGLVGCCVIFSISKESRTPTFKEKVDCKGCTLYIDGSVIGLYVVRLDFRI